MQYKPRKISSITKTDKFISLLGKIISAGEGFTIDDGTGQLKISSARPAKQGDIVRVFCSFDHQWNADIVQNMDNLDMDIYKRVDELYSRAGL